ncbi:hypothetical protein QOZ80_3BG0285550 [Eleusine coracana subsp. coracana]|nr:hypothetical protein QOZ80_3BG0285550 [Eleusine coracana subsp. coracana]
METKTSGSGEAARGKKRPPSRLQKHAPASLQLEQGAGAAPGAWGDGRAPIPLLSPLVVSPTAPPTPVWEADQQQGAAASGARREGEGGGEQLMRAAAARHHGGSTERLPHDAQGWRHPALPTPVAEPASLVPLFQSQCAVEVRGAQQ